MEHTNDPFDEPNYAHGTGEAEDSNGETNIGQSPGTCPSCMVLPLKVGDSFIAAVERATGRRVTGFLSRMNLDPHFVVEIFRLAPAAGSSA